MTPTRRGIRRISLGLPPLIRPGHPRHSPQCSAVDRESALTLAAALVCTLTHAFEVWEVLRVTLKTDARITASRVAIERLGAEAEGVRRAHAPVGDGAVRDSAYYSITRTEWPDLRNRLYERLQAGAQARRPARP